MFAARSGTIRPADSKTLIRTDHLEIFRYALPAGKVIDTHTAAGLMVVQCHEGTVEFTALGNTRQLTPGTMLYLPDHDASASFSATPIGPWHSIPRFPANSAGDGSLRSQLSAVPGLSYWPQLVTMIGPVVDHRLRRHD